MAIIIYKPIMSADTGVRKVGLAIYRVLRENNTVKVIITYKRKDGSYLYPHPFYIPRVQLVGYPEAVVKGTRIVEVPIHIMREAKDEWISEKDLAGR